MQRWVSELLSAEREAESLFSYCFPICEVDLYALPLWRGKSALVSTSDLKDPDVLDFDEIALVSMVLQAIRTCGCDGGVEGGVSSSSDDEKESAEEEVSEKREGVREICRLTADGNDGSMVGKAVVLM